MHLCCHRQHLSPTEKLKLMLKFHNSDLSTSCGLILRSRDFAFPFFFFSNKGEITLHTYRKILGCQSSLTKRATVANISPITAWSGCIWKTKLINKQIIHSQDLCLLACLNKWLVHLTYVKDQGAVLANLVLSFRHGRSQKHKSTTSAFHLPIFDCTDLVFLFS